MNGLTDSMNLGNLCRGAALEMFEKLMPEILANIRNPNTNPTAKRTLTLKFVFEPNDERNYAEVTVVPELKMAGVKPATGSIFISSIKGQPTAFTHDPRQDELVFTEPASGSKQ